jgi:multidrug resistance protein
MDKEHQNPHDQGISGWPSPGKPITDFIASNGFVPSHDLAASNDRPAEAGSKAVIQPENHRHAQRSHKAGRSEVYQGSGTVSDPFLVEFTHGDPDNPRHFSPFKKWYIVFVVTISVFAVTLTSSAFAGSAKEIIANFAISQEVYALGISLYVLGFAVGPPLWGPLSELYGRTIWYITTHAVMVAFVAGCAGANSIVSLLAFRFLAGIFGASPLTNSGGFIADLFEKDERGVAMSLFSTAPFLGPLVGPIIGGFISTTIGWRWGQGAMAIYIGIVWLVGSFTLPETYGPVILERKAQLLSKKTGKTYISILVKDNGPVSAAEVFGKALRRPWVLLFREPIVFIASAYLAILYGTLYMLLGAFPIVYQELRGWNEGTGGLAFIGVTVGCLMTLVYVIVDNKRYKTHGKHATPEHRLPPAIAGAFVLPISIFAFAWTSYPGIHWSASIILSSGFGFGMVTVFISILNYLIDAYTIYAASVLAATAMFRAFFGAAFPLFTTQMYKNLGIHWASSIPAFLTLACLPFPLLMYKYGEAVRLKCKYAKEAASILAEMDEDGSTEEEV